MKKTILYLLLVFSINVFAKNSFVIAPGHVNFDLSHPETQTFLVLNNGDDTIHIRADLKYYPISSPTLQEGKSLKPNYNDNLVPYLLISPPILVLRPGEQRKLRVSVLPPANLKQGSYRAYVKFSMLEFANTIKKQPSTNNKKLQISINIHLNTIASIYANKGTGQAQLTFNCQNKHNKTLLTIKNFSNWLDIGSIKSQNKKIKTIAVEPYSEQAIALNHTHHMLSYTHKEKSIPITCS